MQNKVKSYVEVQSSKPLRTIFHYKDEDFVGRTGCAL